MLRVCLVGVLFGLGAPRSIYAAPLDVRLTLEPGVVTLAPMGGAERRVGYLYGAALAVGISDLMALEVSSERQFIQANAPPRRVDAWAASLVYTIDVLPVTPFVTLGLATARLYGQGSELVPQLGLGFDALVVRWLSLGAVVRYRPIGGTDLLDAPALSSLHLRAGVNL